MKVHLYKRFLPILLGLFSQSLLAQDKPTAAPGIKTFALNPDQLGAAANSVNLFTGDVALPLNLISLPGNKGLDVSVSITYNSNVQQAVGVWNKEAPAGILGLGWSMDVPKIICDYKQTGTRWDDEYFLVEGGSANRLVRTGNGSDVNGSYYTYETKSYQFWKVKYYFDQVEVNGASAHASGPNKWVITKEDGTQYVYGDKNSARNTIQWLVRWGNWIGHSGQTTGQSRMAYIWNLSEIVNGWGEKVTFEYLNQEMAVGNGGLAHTEASYLKQITDVQGRKVVFNYLDKLLFVSDSQTSPFFIDPYAGRAEPDAYQEVYEKKYLDNIDVLREDGSKFLTVQFGYGVLDNGTNTAKMLLSSIVQKNGSGQVLPGMSFAYNTSGITKGMLQSVTYPTGGTVTYSYKTTNNTISHSTRSLSLPAPPADAVNTNGYGEPRAWLGNDYVVVAWRALGSSGAHDAGSKDVKLYAYQWVGEWKEQFLHTINSVQLLENGVDRMDYKDFQVVVQKNFFAVLSPSGGNIYQLYIWYKDEANRGQWANHSASVDYGEGLPKLLAGEHFVVVGAYKDDDTHPSHRYTFQDNSWKDDVLNQTVGDHYYTAGHNYFISHNRLNGSAEMNFHYLSEDKKWVNKSWGSNVLFSSSDRSYWYGSNSYAVAMAHNNPEMIYSWDVTYTNFYRDNTSLGTWADNSYVFNVNNSLIGIVQAGSPASGSPAAGKAARFDGSTWQATANISAYWAYRFSYGDDYALWTVDDRQRPVVGYLRKYDPYSMTWSDANLSYTPNTALFGSIHGHNPLKAGVNFFTYHDKGYFLRDGNYFSPDYTFSAPSGTGIKANSLRIGSEKYLIYQQVNSTYQSNVTGTVLQFMKNGQMSSTSNSVSGWYSYMAVSGVDVVDLLSPTTIVTFNNASINNASSLTLYRVVGESVTGSQTDTPVSLITVSDGSQSQYTSFDYNFATATIDPSGSIAQYNEVTTIPGSNVATSKPYGYTKTFFYNGLTAAELGLTTSIDQRWSGMPYQTQVYNSANTLIASTKSTFSTYSKEIKNSDGTKVAVGYYVRPIQTNSTADGVETIAKQYFDANTGLITESIVYDYDSDNGNDPKATNYVRTRYKYFWEQYDTSREKNMLTPVIQTKQSVYYYAGGEVVTAVSATTFKSWNNVYAPHKTYQWKRTGAPDFNFASWSNDVEPTADWIKLSQVDAIDKGNIIQLTTR